MCGIAGLIDVTASHTPDRLAQLAAGMAARLRHRGPDKQVLWLEGAVALAHRRLSIIDLSPAGDQPMASHCGRFVITFNGEIYNFKELRKELSSAYPGISWRGHGDTEVLITGVERWGIDRTLRRLKGMFALAVYDRVERRLYLSRDRVGEKPLYYFFTDRVLAFASELKAFGQVPGWEGKIDPRSVRQFLGHSCVPSPSSIYLDTYKVPPGELLEFSVARDIVLVRREPYWTLSSTIENSLHGRRDVSFETATSELDTILRETVASEMVSDVPLGAFLSGGVDSSLIVALMQQASSRPVKTFTIGFTDARFDESKHARRVAAHLGTDHTELVVEPREALEIISSLPDVYDEPFSDPSEIPTIAISRLARSAVTVALSGDGGDEMFGGYTRHTWINSAWAFASAVPRPAKKLVNRALLASGGTNIDAWLFNLKLPQSLRIHALSHKAAKLALSLNATAPLDMYRLLSTHWSQEMGDIITREAAGLGFDEPPQVPSGLSNPEMAMYLDTIGYLPNDILVKLDRAAMSVGLETRVPYLHPDVLQYAWSLPESHKISGKTGKRILRSILSRYVPEALFSRPKQGFGIPIRAWLRRELRDWAEDLLSVHSLNSSGLLQPQAIRSKWDEHLRGVRNWEYLLWDVLMFQGWYRTSRTMEHPEVAPEALCAPS